MGLTRREMMVVAVLPAVHARPVVGQPTTHVPRVGFITGSEGPTPRTAAFVRALEVQGYVVGKTVHIDWRFAAGRNERYGEFVRELVSLPVDVIVAAGPQPIGLASRATKSIPIVMAAATDPVRLGVVRSLRHPGGNVTGATVEPSPELWGKQVQMVKEAFPRLERLAVMSLPEVATALTALDHIRRAADQLAIRLHELNFRAEQDLDAAFLSAKTSRAEAVLVFPDSGSFGYLQRFAELELKYQLPGMHFFAEYVAAGGLMSYGPTVTEQFERGAVFVGKILKGANPGDLPVEQPTRFELVINARTARALGLVLPQAFLLQATKVIE